jgi:hypothetical protein
MPTFTSQGTCVAATPPGAANQPCGTKSRCESGLYCSQGGITALCLPRAQASEACAGEIDGCVDGLTCVPLDATSGAICLPPATKGGACQARAQCGGVLSTMLCDDTLHTCVDAPDSGPCDAVAPRCNLMTSYCDTSIAAPVCQPYVALGDTCAVQSAACGFPRSATCVSLNGTSELGVCTPPTIPAACVP